MRTHLRAAATALVVVALLCAGAAGASASRSFTTTGGARRGVREIDRTLNLKLGAITIVCESTMVKDIHSLIPKVVGALFGFVTDLRFANCRETLGGAASARGLIETPWHIRYQSFTGTLPMITGVLVRIVDAKILITLGRVTFCLYRGDIPIFKTGRAGLTVEDLTNLRHQVPLFRALEGSTRCPSELEFEALYDVEPPFILNLA
jgi:hypothetical protein